MALGGLPWVWTLVLCPVAALWGLAHSEQGSLEVGDSAPCPTCDFEILFPDSWGEVTGIFCT